MSGALNALRWNRQSGHYEVYYVTLTDRASGVGIWIRYTMVAPLAEAASAALWFLAMDPRPGGVGVLARKRSVPIDLLDAEAEPFRLAIDGATLGDGGAAGAIGDVAWDLRWQPGSRSYRHVDPWLARSGVAKTVLVLPQPDLAIDGAVTLARERLELAGARGGQAHLWGSKHASSWAWVHCNDFETLDGGPVRGAFVDAVSVFVNRFGREVGPSTPVLARIDERDFISTSPPRVVANHSTFGLTGWRFEAVAGRRKLIGQVDADRGQLAGVTYHDPDGALAYCYNSETASMQLHLYERARQVGGWAHRTTLVAPARAHFEYGQRMAVAGVELVTS
jgi:hypothetical protein